MLTINLKKLELSGFLLKNISFKAQKGEMLFLVGLNGSGKTTLLKTLAGIYSTLPKEMIYKNKTLLPFLVEYIPPALQPTLSLKVQFFLEASLNRLFCNKEETEKILKVARFLKITPLLQKDIKNLSSGEMAKVLLAKALLSKKPIILWDEPTSFLDIAYQKFLQKVLLKLKSKKIWIFSSHHYAWAKPLASRYIGLLKGEQIFNCDVFSKKDLKKILL